MVGPPECQESGLVKRVRRESHDPEREILVATIDARETDSSFPGRSTLAGESSMPPFHSAKAHDSSDSDHDENDALGVSSPVIPAVVLWVSDGERDRVLRLQQVEVVLKR